MRGRWALGVVALLVAACGQEPTAPSAPPSAAPSPAVSGEVMQYRANIARRIMTVRLRTDAALDVRGLVLRPAAFEASEPTAADAQLDAGSSVDLRAGYGAARCDETPDGPTEAVLDVVRDGAAEQVTVALDDRYGLVRSLHAYECTERALRSQVEVAFVGGWTEESDVLRGTLRLRRLGGTAEVLVSELEGTTLLGITGGPPGGPVAVLPPDAGEVSVPVTVEASRCDDHALIESKRATAFGAFVALDGGTLVRLVVEPAEAERGTLTGFASARCSAGPPG